jgi:hypothetical protein
MFKAKDTVVAKNPNLPFWMVVDRVNVKLEIAYCSFGTSGRYAGGFQFNDLVRYNPNAS